MESISVTKPDMAVLKTGGAGLSPFGMLSALFGQEVLRRSRYSPGNYRPAPLELLEEKEPAPAVRPAPEVKLDLDLTLIIKALKEEQKKEREQDRRETAQAAQRILERVLRREEKLRAQETTRYIILQSGLTALAGAAGAAGQNRGAPPGTAVSAGQNWGAPPGAAVSAGQNRGALPGIVVYGGQKNIALSRVDSVTMNQLPRGGLEPVSSCTAAPSAGGWKPRWQQGHPGFAPKGVNRQEGAFYSILLPDVLRRRREEFLREQEQTMPPSAAYQPERWTDGAEHVYLKAPISRERLAREVSLAVEHALQNQKHRSTGRAQTSGQRQGDRGQMGEPRTEAVAPEAESQELDIPYSEKEDKRAGEKTVPPALLIEHTSQEGKSQTGSSMSQSSTEESVQKKSAAADDVSALPLAPSPKPDAELVFRVEERAETANTVRPAARAAGTEQEPPRQKRLDRAETQTALQREEKHGKRGSAPSSDAPDGEARPLPEESGFQRKEAPLSEDRSRLAVPAAGETEASIDEVLSYRSKEVFLPGDRKPETADNRPAEREKADRRSEGTGPTERASEGRPGQMERRSSSEQRGKTPGREGTVLQPGTGRLPAGPDGISRQESFEPHTDKAGAVTPAVRGEEAADGTPEKDSPSVRAVPGQEHERGEETVLFGEQLVYREEAAQAEAVQQTGRAIQQERDIPAGAAQPGTSWQSDGAVRQEQAVSRRKGAGAAAAVPAEGASAADGSAADGAPTVQAVPVQESAAEGKDAFRQTLIYRQAHDVRAEEYPQAAETQREPLDTDRSRPPVVTPAAPGREETGEDSQTVPQAPRALPAERRRAGEDSAARYELTYQEREAEQEKRAAAIHGTADVFWQEPGGIARAYLPLRAVPVQPDGQTASFGRQVQLIYGEQSTGAQSSVSEKEPEWRRDRLAGEGPWRSGVTAAREIRILGAKELRKGAAAGGPLRDPVLGERTVELSYLSPPGADRENESIRALPPWAQRLMEYPDAAAGQRPGGTISFGRTAGESRTPSGARQGDQSPGGRAGRQIQWSAPNGTMAPANISYLESKPAEPVPSGPAPMGERELRRTADKVYRIIEERLRRELRRSGR